MLPHVGVGGGTPIPRNESADSIRIADATPKLADASTARAARSRGLCEFHVANPQELPAYKARLRRPRRQPERDHDGDERRAKQRDDAEDEKKEREAEDDLDQS